jgi:hypothetical protein
MSPTNATSVIRVNTQMLCFSLFPSTLEQTCFSAQTSSCLKCWVQLLSREIWFHLLLNRLGSTSHQKNLVAKLAFASDLRQGFLDQSLQKYRFNKTCGISTSFVGFKVSGYEVSLINTTYMDAIIIILQRIKIQFLGSIFMKSQV